MNSSTKYYINNCLIFKCAPRIPFRNSGAYKRFFFFFLKRGPTPSIKETSPRGVRMSIKPLQEHIFAVFSHPPDNCAVNFACFSANSCSISIDYYLIQSQSTIITIRIRNFVLSTTRYHLDNSRSAIPIFVLLVLLLEYIDQT